MDDYLLSIPNPAPLTYEETPVIEPISQPVSPVPPPLPPGERKPMPLTPTPAKPMSPILLFLILAVVFGIGVWASSYLRQFLPSGAPQKQVTIAPTPTPTVPPDPYAGWKTYSVISGVTHKAVGGISFKLPPEITELFCDGSGCSSQGTMLPGGTRFTVAARGSGQVLMDYRGKIVTDAGGKPFVTTPMTVADRGGLLFVGDFAGRTVTGYTFTKMRGVMISVTDTLSLEVNHFTPTNNPSADFASDDVLFDKILGSFSFNGLPTPMVTPTSATSSATP